MKTTTTQTGSNFAVSAKQAAAKVQGAGRFGRHKVFMAAVAAEMGMTMKDFGALAIAAHRARELTLCRADLVQAMSKDMVRNSEVSYMGVACFHMINLEA